MTSPAFTAEASLYLSTNRYRSSGVAPSDWGSGEPVIPAFHPGPETQKSCDVCLGRSLRNYGICLGIGAVGCGVGCALFGPFWPACFAPCMGAALGGCNAKQLIEAGICVFDDCCPKRCGPPDLSDLPGSGCCDAGDRCVDENDPNSRHGCCPSDQAVCEGKCCAKGESCCGGTCCPRGFYCLDGVCSEFPVAGPPFGVGEPPKGPHRFERPKPQELLGEDSWKGIPRQDGCPNGWTPCYDICCGPGLQCCNGVCRTLCLH